MIAQKAHKALTLIGVQAGSRQMAVRRVMLSLALCALIAGVAPVAAAFNSDDSTPPQRLYAVQAAGIYISDDAGMSWTPAGDTYSRPLSAAGAPGTPGLVFAGTESSGLLRSNDGGASWQAVESVVLTGGNAAPLAVTAVAIDPEDEQIVYAATNIWLGTHTARLTPVGVAVSVDGGRQWLQLNRAQLGDTPLQRLEPVEGRPLAVIAVDATGRSNRLNLELSPELLGLLQDVDPAVRASAARAIGLIGDPAALPNLMQVLADPDPLAGQRIAEATGRIGDRSVVPVLLSMLVSAPTAERTRAALALGFLKSASAVPGLAAMLGTGDPDAKRIAAQALAAIGTPAAIAALMAPLADFEMTPARHASIGGLATAGQSAVAPLAAALLDRNAVVRANAAEMLGWLRPVGDSLHETQSPWNRAGVDATLTQLLSDPDPAVQTQAAWVLGASLAPTFSSGVLPSTSAEPARPAWLPAVILPPILAPILVPGAALPVARAPLAILVVVALLAIVAGILIWRGPRPASRLRHT